MSHACGHEVPLSCLSFSSCMCLPSLSLLLSGKIKLMGWVSVLGTPCSSCMFFPKCDVIGIHYRLQNEKKKKTGYEGNDAIFDLELNCFSNFLSGCDN